MLLPSNVTHIPLFTAITMTTSNTMTMEAGMTIDFSTAIPLNNASYQSKMPTLAERADSAFNNPYGIINIILCVLGILANVLSITATAHIPSGQTTHSKLIISLGVSDILIIISVIYHKLHVVFITSHMLCFSIGGKVILDSALLATLINLLAMAFDHYMAIMKPLKYRQFMSPSRGNCMITAIWFFSLLGGMLDILVGLTNKIDQNSTFCQTVHDDDFDFEVGLLGFILIVLVVMVMIYTRIYLVVRKLMQRDRAMRQDSMHGHKAVITTFLIIGTFVICWIPYNIFQITSYILVHVRRDIVQSNIKLFQGLHNFFFVLLLSNCLCDPIIYAVRLREVQKGYTRIMYKFFPSYRHSINEDEFRHNINSSECPRSVFNTRRASDGCNTHHNANHLDHKIEIEIPCLGSNNIHMSNNHIKHPEIVYTSVNNNSTTPNCVEEKDFQQLENHIYGNNEEDEKSSATELTPLSTDMNKDNTSMATNSLSSLKNFN